MKSILTTTLLALLGLTTAMAAEPAVGTWKLNIAKSKLTTVPKSAVTTITQDGNSRTLETHTVAADGKETHNKATSVLDGKEHPYTGTTGGYDTYIGRMASSHESVFEYKKAGKVVRTVRSNYSKDGKSRTATADGVDDKGKTFHTVSVYDRQ